MKSINPCDDYFLDLEPTPWARIEDAAQPLAGVWGRAMDAPAQRSCNYLAIKKIKIHPLRAAATRDVVLFCDRSCGPASRAGM